MRRRYDRRRAGVAAKAAALSAAAAGATPQPSSSGSVADPPRRRLSSQLKLLVHGHEFQNGDELVLNPEFFPELKEIPSDKYVVEIFHASESQRLREESAVAAAVPFSATDYNEAHNHLLLEVPPSTTTPIRGNLKVSVFRDTASLFQLAPFNDVTVRFVEKSKVQVEFVEVSIKDQFLSRRDLWYLKQSLVGTALYIGKSVRVQGTRWQVMDLRANGEVVRSGVVSATTKFAFRSRTARVMWLVQMSPELWDMANSGKLYLEILLQIVQNVLHKWIKHNVSHSLTIMLFARNYYPELDARDRDVGYGALSTPPRSFYSDSKASSGRSRVLRYGKPDKRSRVESASTTHSAFPFSGKHDDMFAIGVDEDDRHYQDFYKIVAFDSAVTDLQPLLVQLKKEMNEFPHMCGWRSPRARPSMPVATTLPGDGDQRPPGSLPPRRGGVPSPARDGNVLEAINLVLNIFEKHHIDRHLARSGQSVVLITAGNGIFRVKQQLAEITEQRMMDHGIGIDMISLSTPPLHKCPLFIFKQSDLADLPDSMAGITTDSDACTCANGSQHPAAARSTSTSAAAAPRHSRTGSADLSAEPPLENPRQPSQLCKNCLARLATRKRYEVPLWIPLSFVQEHMMDDHKCPLDHDISSACAVCCPLKESRAKDFVPLPMCRLFTDVATWQDTPRSSRRPALPRPLQRLLDKFSDGTNDVVPPSTTTHARTWSDTAFMLDDDYLSLGRDSELVRARAPSLDSDDGLNNHNDSSSVSSRSSSSSSSGLTSDVPPASPTREQIVRACEHYDDAVFRVALPKTGHRGTPRLTSDDSNNFAGSTRVGLTPPLKPANSSSKKSQSVHQRSGTDGEAKRWRSPHSSAMRTTSPGPPTRSSVHSDGHQPRSIAVESRQGGDADTTTSSVHHQDGEDASSVDMLSMPRGRTLGGSLPNTFQLLTAFTNSPILVASSSSASAKKKDDLFHSDAYIYKQLTSNQRRWSQVRPNDGKNPYRLVQSVLKWKSLCFPALLPLTTDYIPGPTELRDHYTQSFYSLTLPERDEWNGVTFHDYRDLVAEMVAQRFSQDFQLAPVKTTQPRGVLYRLTMGHRIHEIVYNEETQTVDVKRFLQKATVRSDVDTMAYRYAMWSPVAQGFMFSTQQFRKYPAVEYQWNSLDQLVCGYSDDMNEDIRYKRILYCVLPPLLHGGDDDEDQATLRLFTDRVRKFLDFIKSKVADASGFPSVQIASTITTGGSVSRSGAAGFKHVSQENAKILLHAPDSPTSQNWLVTRLDTELLPAQCFHIEVRWLVCRSALVEEYIQGLTRRAKQLGLEFIQVPENGISTDLDLHPLVCPIFLPLRGATEQRIVEAALVDRLHFCCEAMHAIPRDHVHRDDEYAVLDLPLAQPANRRRDRFYRQYIHRSFACFVRVTQTGLVWISNQKIQCPDTQPIFEAIRELVASVAVAHEVMQSVLDGALAQIAERGDCGEVAEESEKENVDANASVDPRGPHELQPPDEKPHGAADVAMLPVP